MFPPEPAREGSAVFQLVIDGKPGSIFSKFHDVMIDIGVRLTGSLANLDPWRKFPEFEGLDTPQRAGTLNHRIRYGMEAKKDVVYEVHEHRVGTFPGGSSLVRLIPLSNEFDPSYEFQYALNVFAQGIESAPTASGKLEAFLKSHISTARGSKSDEEIITGIRDTHQRMGGLDFLAEYDADEAEQAPLLDWLPGFVRARFDDYAAEIRPSAGMKI